MVELLLRNCIILVSICLIFSIPMLIFRYQYPDYEDNYGTSPMRIDCKVIGLAKYPYTPNRQGYQLTEIVYDCGNGERRHII